MVGLLGYANGAFELRLNGRPVARGETSECYTLVEVPWEPGVLEVLTDGGAWRLATADPSTAHVVRKDDEWYDMLFSRLW